MEEAPICTYRERALGCSNSRTETNLSSSPQAGPWGWCAGRSALPPHLLSCLEKVELGPTEGSRLQKASLVLLGLPGQSRPPPMGSSQSSPAQKAKFCECGNPELYPTPREHTIGNPVTQVHHGLQGKGHLAASPSGFLLLPLLPLTSCQPFPNVCIK